jgi:superfamily II DNA helicase RecQ
VRGAQYIRASTVRANIRYIVQTAPKSKLLTTAVQICQRQLSSLTGSKSVVYCRSRDQCEEMAQHLGCGFYHAGMGAEDRADQVERWVNNGGFIVATSALGTGVNYADIVYVLHVGMPYGMIGFAQESGRAGRGGQAVDSVILVEEEEAGCAQDASQSVDESVMRAFVWSKSCRRAIMSSYLDGQEVDCSTRDCAACDQCGEGITEWHR